jgi:hypothetical protein
MKTTVKILILIMTITMSCKKKTQQPQSLQPPTTVTNGQVGFDTSKAGLYRMVACDKSSEFSTNVFLSLRYKTYHYYSQDTTDKTILYWIPNNVNTAAGNVKISANVIYVNESINHSQPYIEEHANNVLGVVK